MSDRSPSSSTAAGGVLLALGPLVGVGIGFAFGQATPGFLVGLALGAAAAIMIWLRDRE